MRDAVRVLDRLHDQPLRISPLELEPLRDVIRHRRRRGIEVITWFGRPIVERRSPIAVEVLARVVYDYSYTRGRPRPLPPEPEVVTSGWSRSVPRLDARAGGSEHDWKVTHRDARWLTAFKPGYPPLRVAAATGQHPIGAGFSIPYTAYSEARLPGFGSVRHGDRRLEAPITRFYLNTRLRTAPDAVEEIVAGLLDAGVEPFLLKWILACTHDERADSTVVYVEHSSAHAAARTLLALGPQLTAMTPMFTHELAPGLAVAADPGGGNSFGTAAARQASTILVKAASSAHARHRAPAGAPAAYAPAVPARTRAEDSAAAESHLMDWADALARSALRFDGRAGWLSSAGGRAARVGAAGPDAYRGCPGAVLALAHAVRAGGRRELLDLARGATRDALERIGELTGNGFHNGPAGTAAVIAEAATVAEDDIMQELAGRLWAVARDAWSRTCGEWDVIGGDAGYVLGLVAASRLLRRDVPGEVEAVADRLARRRTTDGPGWTTRVGRGKRALTGLAHGASGGALALNVAAEALDIQRWDDAIDEAIEHELRHRIPATAGWTDRRFHGPVEVIAWCHGAAGIGLADVQMLERHPELRGAVEAAACRLSEHTAGSGSMGCLCHGRVGNVVALGQLGRLAGREDWRAASHHALRRATIDPIAGIEPVPDVSLMTGRSGTLVAWYRAAIGAHPPVGFTLCEPLRRRSR